MISLLNIPLAKWNRSQWTLAAGATLLLFIAALYLYVAGHKKEARDRPTGREPVETQKAQKGRDTCPDGASAGIQILMPAELETAEITEVSPQTWHLRLRGKALGATPVSHLLINGREVALDNETREFSGEIHLDYGINSITLLLLGSDRHWSCRICKIIRRPLVDEVWSDDARGFADPQTQALKEKTRGQIDELVQNFGRRATLGLLREVVTLTISYGAPAYNKGDRTGCYEFYRETAQSLCRRFSGKKAATGPGQSAIAKLDLALKRGEAFPIADRKAWSLRFAFDQILSMWNIQYAGLRELTQMGYQYAQSGWYEEAEQAFTESVGLLKELAVIQSGAINIDAQQRAAPLALASVMYAQRRFPEAGRAISDNLSLFPELKKLTVNRRSFCIREDHYDLVLRDLEIAAGQNENDVDLQFLLGYEYYFLEKKLEANRQFDRVLKLSPQHAGAKLFLMGR